MINVPVNFHDFEKARREYPSLKAARIQNGKITAAQLQIEGIVGCYNKNRLAYTVFVDLRTYPDSLPWAFILHPTEVQISHSNIYHPASCEFLGGRKFPHVCPGDLQTTWNALGNYRNLSIYLNGISQLLNTENFDSPARMC